MSKRQQPDGFDLLLADHLNSSHYFEEADGSHRHWPELSAEGKLAYIASDAAFYDVSFERFRAAVREVLAQVVPAVREEAALRLALRNEKELHAVAGLLPPDERLEGTPLPERVQQALAGQSPPAEASPVPHLAASLRERKVRLADFVIYDTSEAVLDSLEAFGDEFERLAKSPEQRQLAVAFQQFVEEFTGAGRGGCLPADARRAGTGGLSGQAQGQS